MAQESDIYPTRGRDELFIERKDPIFYGYRRMPEGLSDEQLIYYGKRGFAVIPDAFSKSEIAAMNKEFKTLSRRRGNHHTNGNGNGASLIDKNLPRVHRMSELFADVARERRIVDKVEQVLGSDVYLHRSQINVADATTGISYPWHSQFERWHAEYDVPRMRCMEAWVMLTDNTLHNGSMCLLNKSHHLFVACQQAGGPSQEALARLLGFGGVTNAYETAGTLVICDSNLMCGATQSTVRSKRAIAMFSYNSMENLPYRETLPWARPPHAIPNPTRRAKTTRRRRQHATAA